MELTNVIFEKIKQENKEFIISALLGVGEHLLSEKYELFSKYKGLNPEMYFYDIHGNIYIKNIENDDNTENKDVQINWLDEYKALIGYTLQDRYTYEDYIKGGISLLKKNKMLSDLYALDSVSSVMDFLKSLFEKEYYQERNDFIKIKRGKYTSFIVCFVVVTFVCIVLGIYSVYDYYIVDRMNDVVMKAEKAYITGDYYTCLSVLDGVDITSFDADTKKILALAEVNCSQIGPVQKTNMIADIKNSNNDLIYDFWINIHLKKYDAAENLAKQLTSDSLLLHAYNSEYEYLVNDISVDGEEKTKRMDQIQSEISKLKK